jgi:hypothetical protein
VWSDNNWSDNARYTLPLFIWSGEVTQKHLQSGRVDTSGVGITKVKSGWQSEKLSFLFVLKNPHNVPARRFALNSKSKDYAILFDSAQGHCFGDDPVVRHTWQSLQMGVKLDTRSKCPSILTISANVRQS